MERVTLPAEEGNGGDTMIFSFFGVVMVLRVRRGDSNRTGDFAGDVTGVVEEEEDGRILRLMEKKKRF